MSESVESQSRTDVEKLILDKVESSRKALDLAKGEYVNSVLAAHRLGISNVRIAGRAEVTETAIRLMVKRKSGE